MSRTTIAMGLVMLACSVAADAQWLTDRTPGIPRLADGKANLPAPTPRAADGKPDFSGIWIASPHPAYVLNIAADLDAADVQPSATQLFVERMNNFGKDDPASIGCQPLGPRDVLGTYEFVSDEHGVVTHIMAHGIQGSFRIVKRRDAAR